MKKILICDDEVDLTKLMKLNLELTGQYEVYTAIDGKESIKKTKEIEPDLILLDIRMPKIDGLEVVKEIREFDNRIKIIFMTAFQSPQLQLEAAKYNISDYIVKPKSVEDIVEAIEQALN